MTFGDAAATERRLVALAAGGDRAAFAALVQAHQGYLRKLLGRICRGDQGRADDLAQEAFLLAWRKLDQFRGDARFSTWLYRIAYSCFLQACRKRPPPAADADAGEAEQLPAPAHAVDLQLDVERATRRLSAAEQAVLLHCAQLGLSHDEAAYVLAMPLGTVKTHATRGKAKLKEWLAAWHEPADEERIP